MAALGGLAVSPPAHAQQFWEGFDLPRSSWSLFGGLSHSTNAARVAGGSSDTIASVGASGWFFRDQGRLTGRLTGTLGYEEYLDNTYEGDLRASLAAQLRYQLIQDRISWSLDNSFGQVSTNSFAPASPANRTNVNTFSTGPDVDLRFGAVTGFGASGRYGRTDYEDGGLGDERYSGNARLYRRLSQTSTVSAVGSFQRVNTENDPNFVVARENEYDIVEYYARLEARRERYAINLEGGVTELRSDEGNENNPLLRASLYRRLSPSLNLNLSAGQEYRNSGDILRDSIGDTRIVNGEVVFLAPGVDPAFLQSVLVDLTLVNQPIKYEFARATLDWARVRTGFSIYASQSREQYENVQVNLDRDVFDAGFSLTRRLRPNLSAQIGASYNEREFKGSGQSDDTLFGQFSVNWQLDARFGLNFGYRYEDRRSDFAAFSFKDNLFYVGVTYGPGRGTGIPGTNAPAPGTTPTNVVPTGTAPRTGP